MKTFFLSYIRFWGVFWPWWKKRAKIRFWELWRWKKDKDWIFKEKGNKCID